MAAAISTDSVWIGSTDTQLYNLKADGRLLWSYRCASVYSAPALSATDTVYVGSNDSKVYSIDSKGSLIWIYDTSAAIHSSPAIIPDAVCFGSYDNVLYVLAQPTATPTPTRTPTPGLPTPTPTCLQGLRVWLNQSSYKAGDTFEAEVSFSDTYMDWDGYLVFVRNGNTWSSVKGGLKRGVHARVKDRLEIRNCWGPETVLRMAVPHNAAGQYTLYVSTLPTGTKPTYTNARYGRFSQLTSATFTILNE